MNNRTRISALTDEVNELKERVSRLEESKREKKFAELIFWLMTITIAASLLESLIVSVR